MSNSRLIKVNNKSKLIWKKNYYSKSEKKLKPILQLSNNKKFLIVADSIAKYYMLDLENGNLIWSKRNLAPFRNLQQYSSLVNPIATGFPVQQTVTNPNRVTQGLGGALIGNMIAPGIGGAVVGGLLGGLL